MGTLHRRIALIAGCSHAAGHEIDGSFDSSYNRQHSYGNQLAQLLGREPVNIACGGLSNTGIVRNVTEWIHQNYDAEQHDLFVIVGWTESLRMEVPSPFVVDYWSGNPDADWIPNFAGNYLQVNIGWQGGNSEEAKVLRNGVHDFQARNGNYLEMVSANSVLQLQYLFKHLNISYVMSNTMHQFTASPYLAPMLKLMDRQHYMCITDNSQSFYRYYLAQGYTNELAKYWHLGADAHEAYAHRLRDFCVMSGIHEQITD